MAIDGEGLTTQPEAEVSLRDTLSDSLESHTDETEPAPDAALPGKPVAAGTDAAPVAETAEQKAGRTAGRARDEQGRLLPGKPVAATPQAPAPSLPGEQAQPAAAAVPAFKRPTTWRTEAAGVLDKALSGQALTPAEAKIFHAEIEKREGDFANGVSTYKREWDNAKPLIDAVAPFMPIMQQHGIQPAGMISNLLGAHQRMSFGQPQEKMALFQKLIADYQLPAQLAVQDAQGNWQLLGQMQQAQPQQPQFNQQDITRLVQQELTNVSTQQTIQQFEAEAPTKYPHYATVKSDMAGLLQAGLASDLPSAYEAAVRLPQHSAIFDAMQQQQRDADAATAAAARKATVTRARSNAVSTVSSTPSSNMVAASEKGLRQTLAESLSAHAEGRI